MAKKEMHEAVSVAGPSKEKQRAKNLEEISVKRSANGGFIATHRYDNSGPGVGYHEPEQHTFGKGEGSAMMQHVGQHMGVDSTQQNEQVS